MNEFIVSVTGLGYVGLPLAVELSQNFQTIGFDKNQKRIQELRNGIDRTLEVPNEVLAKAKLTFTSELSDLAAANFHIVAVPTPVDKYKRPDMTLLEVASEAIGKILKKGDIVCFESTVYPGATEEVCLPILEKVSGLTSPEDFQVAYSPERINPGDHERTIRDIVKVVSAQTPDSLEKVSAVYSSVIDAGIHRAQSIKVAEAAKVIENIQRDINIALMNELSLVFDRLGIDTLDVIAAASTKWNFLPFKPGLVGGHCIGVDPYYLTHKAESVGYHPEIINSGRRVNDGMSKFVARKMVKQLSSERTEGPLSVSVLGLTFKENCPDLRNTKVIDVIRELKDFGITVHVTDPMADPEEVLQLYGLELTEFSKLPKADGVLIAVRHQSYETLDNAQLVNLLKPNKLSIFDLKGCLRDASFANNFKVFSL